jgi:hypothetical protein
MDPEAKRSDWKRRDVWLGALFVSVGVMSTLFAILAFDHDVPSFFWWTCAWVGPLFLLLGTNAVIRSLLSRK